jgi:hypothetical protein
VPIVVPPANGTATVNPITGATTFTGTAGTTFTYTVADIFGAVSNVVTVGATTTGGVDETASTAVAAPVDINVLAQIAEAITIARAQFTAAGATWRIDGSANAPSPGEAVTICVGNTLNPAKIVGAVLMSVNGSLLFSLPVGRVLRMRRTPSACGPASGTSLLGVAVTVR